MDSDDMVTLAESLVEGARSDTVTVSTLTNGENKLLGGVQSHEPVISYLIEEEQPHYISRLDHGAKVKASGPTGTHESKPKGGISPGGWFVITDKRVIIIVNAKGEDEVISIPLSAIQDEKESHQAGVSLKNESSLLRATKLVIKTAEYTYELVKPVSDEAIEYIRKESGKNQDGLEEQQYFAESETVFVCKKCEQEVSASASKCPHCGYYPGKGGKGALWHGTALAASWTPIGWAMMAKGAADEVRTRKGIAEEKSVRVESDGNANGEPDEEDPFEKLERLKELKNEGIITDKEFQMKKNDILDDI